jgi:hypothetical protein
LASTCQRFGHRPAVDALPVSRAGGMCLAAARAWGGRGGRGRASDSRPRSSRPPSRSQTPARPRRSRPRPSSASTGCSSPGRRSTRPRTAAPRWPRSGRHSHDGRPANARVVFRARPAPRRRTTSPPISPSSR